MWNSELECCKCKIIISRDTLYIMSKMHRGRECQDIVNIRILIQDTEATMEATVEATVTTVEATVTTAEVTGITAAEVTVTTAEATEATTVVTEDINDGGWS